MKTSKQINPNPKPFLDLNTALPHLLEGASRKKSILCKIFHCFSMCIFLTEKYQNKTVVFHF